MLRGIGFGYASLLTVATTIYTHRAASRYATIRYRRLVLPVLGLLPPALAPVIPFPWSLLTLVPVAVLLALPSTRREIRTLVTTLRSVSRPPGPTAVPAEAPEVRATDAASPGRSGRPSGAEGQMTAVCAGTAGP